MTLPHLNYHHLRLFWEVARHGSLRKKMPEKDARHYAAIKGRVTVSAYVASGKTCQLVRRRWARRRAGREGVP